MTSFLMKADGIEWSCSKIRLGRNCRVVVSDRDRSDGVINLVLMVAEGIVLRSDLNRFSLSKTGMD